ncbi:MAG: hypothetical protein ACRDSZ_14290 [Pseudonocardiaceae bacterium]
MRSARLGELGRVTLDDVGQAARVLLVEHRTEQEVDECLVGPEGERLGCLALTGVHRALVAEQLRIQAEIDQVLGPVPVTGLPGQLQFRCQPVCLVQALGEPAHRDPTAVHRERQRVQVQLGGRAEGVPRVAELGRVRRHHVPAPLGDLAGDQPVTGAGVHPFQHHVRDIGGQHELLQYAGVRGAHHLPPAGQHHREDQFDQDRLAAAVLQEQH